VTGVQTCVFRSPQNPKTPIKEKIVNKIFKIKIKSNDRLISKLGNENIATHP